MRTKYMETEFGNEHKRFFQQLDKITTEYYPTDDPKDATFELFSVMYWIDESPEVIAQVHKLLDDWGFEILRVNQNKGE